MTRASHARSPWLRLPRRTARLRLTLLYGGLFLLSGVALVAGTYVLFRQATALTTPRLPKIPQAPTIQPLKRPLKPQLPQALYKLSQDQQRLVKAQNQLAKALPALGLGRQLLTPELSQLARDQRRLTQDQHQLSRTVHQLALAERQVTQAGQAEAAQRASDSHQLLIDSGIALAVMGILALLSGWLVAGRILRPIRTITRTARRISSSSLHERLALDGPEDELKELGDTLDDLFARLKAAFDAQRRFVAHASHELRTPLTRERALVQVALGDPATSDAWRTAGRELLASNRQQESLIDGLLTLASSEGGLDLREPVDLSAIVESVLCARRDGADLGLDIEIAATAAPVEGDPRLLEALIANLVDNAIRHNIEGGHLRVETGSTNGNTVLAVTNTGPIIPADELERLFQPFQRLDPSRTHNGSGHGLGLSIVRAIAIAHDATLTAQPSADGGISIEVTFPRTTEAATAS